MSARNSILKNAASMGIVVLLWCLYSLMTAGISILLEGLTAVVFITVVALLVEDIMEKAFINPGLFTWQYLVDAVFILVADCLWLFFASCSTWLQFALRGLLMAAAAAGTFCWYLFFYRCSILTDDERLIRTLTKAYKRAAKAFPALDDEGVRNALKETLFCRLQGDSLEGELLTDQPFVPGFRTYSQLSGSSDLSNQEKSAAMTNIASYINELVAGREQKAASSR